MSCGGEVCVCVMVDMCMCYSDEDFSQADQRRRPLTVVHYNRANSCGETPPSL